MPCPPHGLFLAEESNACLSYTMGRFFLNHRGRPGTGLPHPAYGDICSSTPFLSHPESNLSRNVIWLFLQVTASHLHTLWGFLPGTRLCCLPGSTDPSPCFLRCLPLQSVFQATDMSWRSSNTSAHAIKPPAPHCPQWEPTGSMIGVRNLIPVSTRLCPHSELAPALKPHWPPCSWRGTSQACLHLEQLPWLFLCPRGSSPYLLQNLAPKSPSQCSPVRPPCYEQLYLSSYSPDSSCLVLFILSIRLIII